ncbi:ubiquitin carboxyl-terminal hydrolase 20-like protein [Dermatophagoides farinae]|uniref:ubiquitinyl hydrolase 1 n=1 Tax=Dermatophagoides farinae TaxID=6954 RepID=A0A9D4P5N8_DERFA|nr:ubiquitin carboxyl-terminal hydrolase 20-like protein [Dermatophagoides farinae]
MNEEAEDFPQNIRGLKGLQNLGNTCYINATLQALLHIRPLRLYFTETYYRRLRLQWDNSIDSLFHQFMMTLWTMPSSSSSSLNNHHHHHQSKNHSSMNDTSTTTTASSSKNVNYAQDSLVILRALVSFIWKRYSFFSPGDQHDSQEFLQCLLGDLHDALKIPFYPESQFLHYKLRNCDYQLRKLAKYLIEHDFDCNEYDADHEYYKKIDEFIQQSRLVNYYHSKNYQPITSMDNQHDISIDHDGDHTDEPILYNLFNQNPSHNQDNDHNCNSNSNHGDHQHLKYRSIISDLFAGELENTIRCTNCGRTSILTETFLNLSIPITAIDRAIQSKIQNSMVFPNIRLSVPFNNQQQQQHQSATNQSSLIEKSLNYAFETIRFYYDYLWNWFDWFMSFLSNPSVDLMDCLETFFNPELLENENRYHCDNCKKLCNGIKCIRIKRLPEILIVHLNRYQNVNSVVRKITSQLTFPLNDFSLKSFLSETTTNVTYSADAQYDLVAVVCHNGTQVTNGHYICYALNEINLDWYEFDDTYVTYVSKDRILSMASSAYILFYQRVDPKSIMTRTMNIIYDIEHRWMESCTDNSYLKRLNLNLQDYYFFTTQSSSSSSSYKVNVDDAFINLKSVPLSKQWLMAFQSLQYPGPIDNSDIFCIHGLIRPTEYLFFNNLSLPVIEPVGQFLWLLYGGGPLFRCSGFIENRNNEQQQQQQYAVCLQCSSLLDMYDERRKSEFNEFIQLQSMHVHMFRKLKLKTTYYYLISAEWIIKWLSFVNVRFDQSTVTARDRQLFSHYEQIFKKQEERQQNPQPYDEQYHRMIYLRTKTIHPPLASLLRSIMNTMNKNQFQIDTEDMLKQIDLDLHTVLPPGPIDNWSIFGIKRKILTENRNRENMNNKDPLKQKSMTIDMATKYDDLCKLFAEILAGQSSANDFVSNNNVEYSSDNQTIKCQYRFAFHSRYGGLYEENSSCVFYLVSSDYWNLFSQTYGGGPTIRFNYLLNKFEANITVNDIEFFIREHYRSRQTMVNNNGDNDNNNDHDDGHSETENNDGDDDGNDDKNDQQQQQQQQKRNK